MSLLKDETRNVHLISGIGNPERFKKTAQKSGLKVVSEHWFPDHHNFTEADFRGDRFKDYPSSLKGNNDLLSLTQPNAIADVHRKYFEAGADIVETNTFSGTTIAMADYNMENLVYELNFESAKIAKEVAQEFNENNRINQDLLQVL